MQNIVTYKESQEYIENGTVSSIEELWTILQDLKCKLTHKHHRRCLLPVKKNSTQPDIISACGDAVQSEKLNRYRCKVADNRLLSPDPANHCFLTIDIRHSPAAVILLEQLGLALRTEKQCPGDRDYENFQHLTYQDKSLQAYRYIPPTAADEGVISPVFGRLCVINPNSDNVQYLDSYGVSKYLAKYVTDVDEASRIFIQAPKYGSTHGTFRVTNNEILGNTKIASVSHSEIANTANKRKNHIGRLMTQTGCLMTLFNIAPVMTNIDFVHVATVPLEERPAVDRKLPLNALKRQKIVGGSINRSSDLDESKTIPPMIIRMGSGGHLFRAMPYWRRYRPSDIVIAKDQMFSPYSLDTVTVFGLRPPELSFIYSQSLYSRWFKRERIPLTKRDLKDKNHFEAALQYCCDNLSVTYERCAWIDSTTSLVKLRAAALSDIIKYVQACPLARFGNNTSQKATVLRFFTHLYQQLLSQDSLGIRGAQREETWRWMKNTFLCDFDKEYLPVVWYTPIRPTNTSRFLFHLLLSMGEFRNEMELLTSGSLRDAYVHAGLCTGAFGDATEDVKTIVRRYITEQLQHMPGGTRQFDRLAIAADAAVAGLLCNNNVVCMETPRISIRICAMLLRKRSKRSSKMPKGNFMLCYCVT